MLRIILISAYGCNWFVKTIELLRVENVFLTVGYQKGRVSSGHHQPHVGRGVDYGVRSTMMGVLQIIMNH